MALKTFSQIPTATSPLTTTDSLIGVRAGTTDFQFPFTQLTQMGITVNTSSITGGVTGSLLFDNGGVIGETPTLLWSGGSGYLAGGRFANSALLLASTIGAGTTDYISFTCGSFSERMRIDTNGLVNIGNMGGIVTTLFGGFPTFQVSNLQANRTNCQIAVHQYSNDAGNSAWISLFKSRGQTAGSNIALHNGDTISFISFSGPDSANNIQDSAFINVIVDQAPTNGTVAGRFEFHTSSNINNAVPLRFMIDSNGFSTFGGYSNTVLDTNNSIVQSVPVAASGAASWAASFITCVPSSSGASLALAHTRGTTPTTQTALNLNDFLGLIAFLGSDGSNYVPSSAITTLVDGSVTTGNVPTRMTFATGSSGYGAERMRIDSNGNVIINTAAIATNATNGFLYLETCAGTPTGAPTSYTGRVPMIYDTSANKIWFYNGSWRGVVVT